MKKDLVIMGAYVKSDESENVLQEAVNRLSPYFDIALVTHTPARKDIQDNVKYFIYDHRNEIMYSRITTVFWGKGEKFYYEMHPDNTRGYHYFAVYRSMMNAVKLLSEDYDSFLYIEGDCHYSPADAKKLQYIIDNTKSAKRKALFLSYDDFLNTNMYYCSMDFFKNVFGFYKNSDEYMDRCEIIGSHGLLENFLYMSIKYNNVFKDVKIINNCDLDLLFSQDSKFDMNRNSGKETNDKISYTFEVLRIKDTNDLAALYISSDPDSAERPMYLDDKHILDFPAKAHSTAIKIFPEKDIFVIKIGGNKFTFDKNKILDNNNKSFIELK